MPDGLQIGTQLSPVYLGLIDQLYAPDASDSRFTVILAQQWMCSPKDSQSSVATLIVHTTNK